MQNFRLVCTKRWNLNLLAGRNYWIAANTRNDEMFLDFRAPLTNTSRMPFCYPLHLLLLMGFCRIELLPATSIDSKSYAHAQQMLTHARTRSARRVQAVSCDHLMKYLKYFSFNRSVNTTESISHQLFLWRIYSPERNVNNLIYIDRYCLVTDCWTVILFINCWLHNVTAIIITINPRSAQKRSRNA